MSDKRETPRTDAEEGHYDGSGCWKNGAGNDCVRADFARQLERELAAKVEECEKLAAQLAEAREQFDKENKSHWAAREESAKHYLAMRERAERAEADCAEQARLNGMGASREAALLAKLERAEADNARLKEQVDATADALDYLHGLTSGSVAALRKDAERYRWMRKQPTADIYACWYPPVFPAGDSPAQRDASIDAALRGTP